MPEPFFLAESFYGQQVAYRFEADVRDCEVVGELPKCLEGGSYFRAGPDDAYPTLKGDNIINGDGRVSAFHFREGGAVDFRCRYVRTERYEMERNARRRLYGKYRNPFTDDPLTVGTDRDNTANTYAFFHHGKLFALREDSRPYTVDPETLETEKVCDFGGALRSLTMTAHPKIDPVSGEWWSFGLFAEKRFDGEMALQVFDRNGGLIREELFMTPYPGLAHDFAVTREHVIFPIMPLTVDKERMRAGGDFYAYDPQLPAMFGIMPRAGTTADIRWYEVPRAFFGHVMNAYTEGSVVHLDAAVAPGNSFRFYNHVDGSPTDPSQGVATITRLSFDLSHTNDHVTRTPFPEAIGEMPRMDERFAMSRYRYGFTRTPQGVGLLDWDTLRLRFHSVAADKPAGAQEPAFVPRSADAPEGDGYVLTVVNRFAENRADLIVIDTRNFEGTPQAIIRLPFNEPFSFHGGFVSAADKRVGRSETS